MRLKNFWRGKPVCSNGLEWIDSANKLEQIRCQRRRFPNSPEDTTKGLSGLFLRRYKFCRFIPPPCTMFVRKVYRIQNECIQVTVLSNSPCLAISGTIYYHSQDTKCSISLKKIILRTWHKKRVLFTWIKNISRSSVTFQVLVKKVKREHLQWFTEVRNKNKTII